jgi:penicillin-binding protein 1A
MSRSRSPGVRILLGLAVLLLGAASAGAGLVYWTLLRDLPDFRSLADYRPSLTTRVLDRDGRPVGEFFERRRRLVQMREIPQHVVLAFVASEDDSFFEHAGLDYVAILRAALVDLWTGEKKQGASTITMQTAKNLLLTPERAFRRKLKEMILARRIEERFSKDEILFLYLNEIYFGSGAYGLGEAARSYFDKPVGALDVSEAALLAGLPKAPSRFSPFADPEAAEERRRYVLDRMREAGFLDASAHRAALAARPALRRPGELGDFEVAAYFTEEVRRALFEALGAEAVLRGGLTVHTTLDLELQRAAVAAVRRGLEALDRRQGFRGAERRVAPEAVAAEVARLGAENAATAGSSGDWSARDASGAPLPLPGVVTRVEPGAGRARVAFAPGLEAEVELEEVSWARRPDPAAYPTPVRSIAQVFAAGDVARFVPLPPREGEPAGPLRVTLHQEPLVEGSLFALEISSGEVLALVGGYDFRRSEFDRALQARRQPGSAFKPLIYATALENGYTGASIVHDRPVVYTDEHAGYTWRPENYGRRFLGPLTLREALSRSVNNATIHLLKDVGVGRVIELATRLGIESPLEPNLSLALGTNPVSLFELVRAYATFPAGGRRVVPRFVRRVEDREGRVLLEALPLGEGDRVAARSAAADAGAAPAAFEPQAPAPGDPPGPDGARAVLAEQDAYLMVELLRAVVQDRQGTGRRAQALARPLAGKTGTTNEQADAWFVGFSPDVIAGAWVGFDEKRVLGRNETGGRAALPIWMEFMQTALAGRPVRDFPMPEGIVVARIDRGTGLLADAESRDVVFQAFREGTEPTEGAAAALSSSESRRRLRLEF